MKWLKRWRDRRKFQKWSQAYLAAFLEKLENE